MSDERQAKLAPGLYLVSTPIGNLEDITLRALRVLREADRIACEDTRQTQKLLNHYDISTPTVSCHEHNERERATELIAAMQGGARIAVVSDAGTPGISDPGMYLARAAIAAGIPVFPVPGANAAISALIASGLDTERFFYAGFLPPKSGARRDALEQLAASLTGAATLVFYEAPHRILETLADVESVWGCAARVVVARELTKLHEEFARGTAAEVAAFLKEKDRIRGEIVLLVAAAPRSAASATAKPLPARLAELMQAESLTEMEALKRIARERGISKSEAYRELQRSRPR
ncbi:16S rRNA (cytidine(1402)-2'-O)-methyltransferase [Acidipila rosea]|uniref:Ribosomal RNA small subunit methyltransferase I n=1 Tax=Acidipila rosea TaxID=768535 RepID=A0A4R1L3N9_9BACT|nr:16S rRNA (cytidine(1402)-2'-O)-methyltransferase [Acidipila rosea]TCK72652.1 16S rRNA (cytidine1402-2'-O)-methyltransferase [Acidipila rosea]